jgi:hypothetical protein
MGHIGEKIIRSVENKCMVKGFLDFNLEVDFFENFIYGKQNRVRFYMEKQGKNRLWNLYIVMSLGL